MVHIIEELQRRGNRPTIVYNSGGYDCVQTLRELDGIVDVYLPDFKYMEAPLAALASGAPNYPGYAQAAMLEMLRQMKDPGLEIDKKGLARHGLIVRHLVLPGHPENSLACLDWMAEHLSPEIHISLMSQYHPTAAVSDLPPFNRRVSEAEYDQVCLHLGELGFENGWIQELESSDHYRPDFDRDHPFE
jgi:putative pyruvate formate lyase activating enzyme